MRNNFKNDIDLYYVIILPADPRLPILLADKKEGSRQEISLKEVKDFLFKAILQNFSVAAQHEQNSLVDTVIYVAKVQGDKSSTTVSTRLTACDGAQE